MKKNIIKTGIFFIAILLTLSACNKKNIKYANSRIVGTWELSTMSYTFENAGSDTETYTTNSCGYENDLESYTVSGTYEVTGNTVHEIYTEVDIENGEETTETVDTTYTASQTYKLTINEDGTFTEKNTYSHIYEDGDSYSSNFDRIGYWVWVDSYLEKQGIQLIYKSSDGNFYEQIISIESLDKDNLVFKFKFSEKEISESSEKVDECGGIDVIGTYKEEYYSSFNGTRVLNKVD